MTNSENLGNFSATSALICPMTRSLSSCEMSRSWKMRRHSLRHSRMKWSAWWNRSGVAIMRPS